MESRKEERGWWEERRWRYNAALLVAGIVGFFINAINGELCPRADPSDDGIPVVFAAIQGCGFLVMMGVANLFYCLGYIVDEWAPPKRLDQFRTIAWWTGLGFSVALPTVPLLIIGILCWLKAGVVDVGP